MKTDANLGFRRAYTTRLRPVDPGSVTPAEKVESAVLEIVRFWNENIPRNRVRILTTARFLLVRAVLVGMKPQDVLDAIEFYSRQPWQRRKAAWKTFDNFFYNKDGLDPPVLRWWEKAAWDAEKKEQSLPAADPLVRGLQEQVAGRMNVMQEFDKLVRKYDALSPVEQTKLLQRARKELVQLGRRPSQITWGLVRNHAIRVILQREVSGSAESV